MQNEFNQEDKIILYVDVKVPKNKERGRSIGTHASWNDKMQLLLTSAVPAAGTRLETPLGIRGEPCLFTSDEIRAQSAYALEKCCSTDWRGKGKGFTQNASLLLSK